MRQEKMYSSSTSCRSQSIRTVFRRLHRGSLLLAVFLLTSAGVRGEAYRGEMNGWGTSWMYLDTSYGSIWKTTVQAPTEDASSEFKFDRMGDWSENWGAGTNALVNSSVGSLAASGGNLTIPVFAGGFYTFQMDAGHGRFVVMRTDANPVNIVAVYDDSGSVGTNPVTVTITPASSLSTQEVLWVRYATNANFTGSSLVQAQPTGSQYRAVVPGKPLGIWMYYYVLSSSMPFAHIQQFPDLCTLRGANNFGANYSYRVQMWGGLTQVTNQRAFKQAFYHDMIGAVTNLTDERGTVAIGRASDGRITSVADRLGSIHRFEYNTEGRLQAYVDPESNRTAMTEDAYGRPLVVTNTLGEVWQIGYDGRGNRVLVTDPLGHHEAFAYDAYGQLARHTNKVGGLTEHIYDAFGNCVQITQPDGYVRNMEYDAVGRQTNFWDNAGSVTSLTYDAAGNILQLRDGLGRIQTFSYDAANLQTSSVNFRGAAVVRSYNAAGLLTNVTFPDGSFTSYVYDVDGRPVEVRDGRGLVVARTYSSTGDLLAESNALGEVTAYVYDSQRRRVRVTRPAGREDTYGYDRHGRITAHTNALGWVRRYAYDSEGRLLQETDEAGYHTWWSYDALGRVLSISNALGHVTMFAYDAAGNKIAQINPDGSARSWKYDASGRLTNEVDEVGRVSAYSYDVAGRLSRILNPQGHVRERYYDTAGRLTAASRSGALPVTYAYDASDNLTVVTNARGGAWRWTYDTLDRPVLQTDADGHASSLAYDSLGRLAFVTLPDGTAVARQYDLLNRLTNVACADAFDAFTYDMAGRRVEVRNAHGSTFYQHDLLDRVTNIVDTYGQAVSYEYDARGKIALLRYPGGHDVRYDYDKLGRCTNVLDWHARETRFEYDGRNRLTRTTFPNGLFESRQYDAAGRLTNLTHGGAASNLMAIALAYGGAGPTSATVNGGVAVDLTSSVVQASYSLDDRLTALNGEMQYTDPRGQFTNFVSGGSRLTATYDYRGLLTTISGPSLSLSNIYNAVGQRIGRVLNGAETRYVLADRGGGEQVIADCDAANDVQRYYVHGPGGLLYSFSGAADLMAYHGDAMGNVVLCTDAGGTTVQRYAYTPFGRVIASSGALANEYMFAGKFGVMAEAADLLFMRARYYDSQLGRFLSKDPVFDVLTAPNRYAYAYGDPLSQMDAYGLYSWRAASRDAILALVEGIALDVIGERTPLLELFLQYLGLSLDLVTIGATAGEGPLGLLIEQAVGFLRGVEEGYRYDVPSYEGDMGSFLEGGRVLGNYVGIFLHRWSDDTAALYIDLAEYVLSELK